jgi:paraquat-inducible protein A
MSEVMMLGILVALVKIADLATVVIGVGMVATGVLIALITLVAVNFDSRKIWTQVQWTTVDVQSLPNPTPTGAYQEVNK